MLQRSDKFCRHPGFKNVLNVEGQRTSSEDPGQLLLLLFPLVGQVQEHLKRPRCENDTVGKGT